MGKKKGPRQKGEAIQVAFGGGAESATTQASKQVSAAQQRGDVPFWQQEEQTQSKRQPTGAAAAIQEQSTNDFVDFGAENQFAGKKSFQGKKPGRPQGGNNNHRQVQQVVQPGFHSYDDDRQESKQPYQDYGSGGGQYRPQQSAYQAKQQSSFNSGNGRGKRQYDNYNNEGGGGKRYNNDSEQFQRKVSYSQADAQSSQNQKAPAQQKATQKQSQEARMTAPKVDDGLKEQICEEYDAFDLDTLLQENTSTTGDKEEGKTAAYSVDASKQHMYSLFTQLQESVSASKATPIPAVETVFGGEAVQPLQPPFFFNLGQDDRNFEAAIGPWRLSREQIASQMLLREASQVRMETFDAIFKFDQDELKRKAICERFRNDPKLQGEVGARMNEELSSIYSKLTQKFEIELSAITQETVANINVASGLLDDFSFGEPKEPFELEPDFEGDAKTIIMQQRLQDEQEIDQLLENAADPFADVPEDDEADQETLISKFLADLRDMDVLQHHQEKFKEKQQDRETAGYKAQQMLEKQQVLGKNDSDVEEEETKDPQSASTSQDASKISVINTGGDTDAYSQSDRDADLQEIEEILQGGEAYKRAVSESQKQGLNASRLQAEPSHFHLAALAKERQRRPLKKAGEAAVDPAEDSKEESWVVKDQISMANFKQLVQDPAIEYPFELDDFQKRAVYRLEQGNCVMVAAHTSAGKTLVAEYAIALSRRHMTKTIYTSPIKSLSNQKYRDFKLKFGDVGMLTGDVQLNKDASCLIMTTEILQQMLYNDSSRIADVEWVIFDEVHYINDEQRGSVWEEVIIKLPDHVSIVMLSATVPNYLEFAQWVGRVKQKKIFVQYTQERPVPLQHNSIIDGRMIALKQQNKPVDQVALKDCSKQRGILKNKSFAEKNNPNKSNNNNKQGGNKQPDKNDPNQKKIDFKAKALKAKENSVKKVVAKGMKSSGAKGPSTGGGQSAQGKKKSNFEKTLLAVQKMNLLPSIVFTFSRAGTFQYAEELDPQIDFTDGYTKGLIKKFIKQKIQRLDEVDRDLPQIQLLTKLMSRGIGIHHAGLLQILKELVEILFSDGYLKVVFATSTFAIGLNLPARSVIFTGLKKFDGSDFGTISTSEYLQMAGRAGRRGKDDCGFSVLCMDPGHQVPPNSDLVELLESKGIELESKLNVNYDMCLNSLKQDSDEFGTMLKNSFFANETATVKIQARQKKKKIEPIYDRAMDVQCVYGAQDQVKELYSLIDLLWDANDEISGGNPPIPLTIVQVVTEKNMFKDAVVLSNLNANRSYVCIFSLVGDSLPIAYEEEHAMGDFESAMKACQPTTVPIPGSKGEVLQYECREIANCMITATYNEQATSLKESQLHFLRKSQLAEKQIKLLAKDYHSLIGNLTYAPVTFGGGKKKTKTKLQNLTNKRDEIVNQIRKTKCWNCEQVSYHLTQLEVQDKYKNMMADIEKVLQGNVDEKEADFNNRNSILIQYKIIDEDLNILFKGKVAMQACQDKVLMTEFFFSGLINDLTDQELLAILSVFITTERASGSVPDCGRQYSEKFTEAYDFIEKQANMLIQFEQDAGVMEEQLLAKRLNFKYYELVYDWADQKTFKDVVMDTGIDEGSVIKMIMAVNRTRQAIEKMATVVGDNALATRMQEMENLINRGIVKMQSLYLEVEQEPQRLNTREEDFALNFDPETGLIAPIKDQKLI